MPYRARLVPVPRKSPRPPVPRHDGFSPAQQRLFLETLAATGRVAAAAAAAGVSRTTAYRHRHDPRALDFREGWTAALARAVGVLVDTAFERALDGVEEPVFQRGEQVGTRVRHDGRLLRFLVANRGLFAPQDEAFRDDGSRDVTEEYPASRLAAHLDRIDPPPPRAARDRVSPSSLSPAEQGGAAAPPRLAASADDDR